MRIPGGAIAGFVTPGPIDKASMLLIIERGHAKPITETLESGESLYECAARGAGEEATPHLRQSMLDSSSRAELTRFNGTPAFLTVVSDKAVSMPYEPSQSPPETQGMAWFAMSVLTTNTGPVTLPDITGAKHMVARMGTSFAKLVASLLRNSASEPAAKRAKPAVRVVTPGAAASRSGLAILCAAATAGTGTASPANFDRSARADIAMAAAVDTFGRLPLIGEAPAYEREVTLPVSGGFTWPTFTHFAFMEHSGVFVASWAARGKLACSVAERRCAAPPPPGCMHVIGRVQDFVAVYPHPLGLVTSHVTCTSGAWAASSQWETNVRNGSILRSAEELLWCMSLGAKAAAEQGPSAHARLLGEPSCKTRAEDHGARGHKWYWWWLRGLDSVQPSSVVPDHEVLDLLGAVSSKDPETRMLLRSTIERSVADAHTAAWDTDGDAWGAQTPRAAHETCDEYPEWRAALLHNYSIFAARYAPRLSLADVATSAAESKHIIVVPVVHTKEGLAALVTLQTAHFGALVVEGESLITQATEVATALGGGEPMLACMYPPRQRNELIFVLPVSTTPIVLASAAEVLEAQREGADTVWCLIREAAGLDQYARLLAAADRVGELQGETIAQQQATGKWATAQPVAQARAGELWARAPASGEAQAQWTALLARDRATMESLRDALGRVDEGDGLMHTFAAKLQCISDLTEEISLPSQAPPDYSLPMLRMAWMPQRPPPLSTGWLTKLPPQPVPPGGDRPRDWTELVSTWGRRRVCDSLNRTAEHDLEMWRAGASGLRRPAFLCLGDGAQMRIEHADGVGSWGAWDVIWERRPDGLYVPMDFDREFAEHKNLDFLKGLLGNISNKLLLSLLFEGMRYQARGERGPPREIRIAHNLESLGDRLRGVSAVMAEHVRRGMCGCVKLRKADDPGMREDGAGPLGFCPGYATGVGGVDKTDSPGTGVTLPAKDTELPGPDAEKRLVCDSGAPYDDECRARNKPHGDPDGELVRSLNEMTGNSKAADDAECAWPGCERKPTVKMEMRGGAVCRHLSHLNDTMCVVVKDDVRWMFWQFWLAPSEYWITMSYMWLVIDGELWFCAVYYKVMTMGVRPSSKVACWFAEEFLEAWAQRLDTYVETVWLPRQTPALRECIRERVEKLGARQGRPWWARPFTDDFAWIYVGSAEPEHDLAAHGTMLWRRQCTRARLIMSDKVGGGTVLDWIGARIVINGGFGTLTPQKRARAILECTLAKQGDRDADELQSTNSYLAHVADLLAAPVGKLRGLGAPIKAARMRGLVGTARVSVEGFAAFDIYTEMTQLMQTRGSASLLSAVPDAPATVDGDGRWRLCVESDSCSDVPRPHVCGVGAGLFWRFELAGAWKEEHITLTEALGPVFNSIIFPPLFPETEILLGTDSLAAAAVQLGQASAPKLVALQRRQRASQAYQSIRGRLWVRHVAGIANMLSDLGSRDRMREMYLLAAAFGMRLTEIEVPKECLQIADGVMQDSRRIQAQEAAQLPRDGEVRGSPTNQSLAVSDPSNDLGDGPWAWMWLCLTVASAAAAAFAIEDRAIAQVNKAERPKTRRCACPLACDMIVYPPSTLCDMCGPCGSGVHGCECHDECPGIFCGVEVWAAGTKGGGHLTSVPGCGWSRPNGAKASARGAPLVPLVEQLLDKTPGTGSSRDAPVVPLVEQLPVGASARGAPLVPLVEQIPGAAAVDAGTAARSCRSTRVGHECSRGRARAGGTLGSNPARAYGYKPSSTARGTNGSHARMALVQCLCPLGCHAEVDPSVQFYCDSCTGYWVDGTVPCQCDECGECSCCCACMRIEDEPEDETDVDLIEGESGSEDAMDDAVDAASALDDSAAAPAQHPMMESASPTLDVLLAQVPSVDELLAQQDDAPPTTIAAKRRRWALIAAAHDAAPANRVAKSLDWSSDRTQYPDCGSQCEMGCRVAKHQRPTPSSSAAVTRQGETSNRARCACELGCDKEVDTSFGVLCANCRTASEPCACGRCGHCGCCCACAEDGHSSQPESTASHEGSASSQEGQGPHAAPGQGWGRRAALRLRGGSPRHQPGIRQLREASPERFTICKRSPASERAVMVKTERSDSPEPLRIQPPPVQLKLEMLPKAAYDSPPERVGHESAGQAPSPQPTSAKAARSRAAVEVGDRLANDSSKYALCPGEPGRLQSMVSEAARLRDEGIPIGTAKADEVGFKKVMLYCQSINTPWMRPAVVAEDEKEREAWLYAMALVAIACSMKPGAKNQAKGITRGKPASALGYLYAFRRVMVDCSRYVPPLVHMLKACRGLNLAFKQAFGQDSLIPARTMPFSLGMLNTMVRALVSRAIGGWTSVKHAAMLVLVCFCLATGTRKDEWTRGSEPHTYDTYLLRSNFSLHIGGREAPMTPANLRAAENGHYIRGRSAPSKCDRDNITWGAVDQWFRIDRSNPLNFAHRWVEWELAYPCPVDQRHRWPAFSPSGDATPFSPSVATDWLQQLMVTTIGAVEAALRSWHAFRVTIACALLATERYKANPQTGDAIIQTLVRWKTPDSIRVYGKMLPSEYADHVDAVTRTDGHRMADMVGSVAIDASHATEMMSAAVQELETAVAAEKSASTSGWRGQQGAPDATSTGRTGTTAPAAPTTQLAALGPPKTARVERPAVPTPAAAWLRGVSHIEGTVVSVNTTFFGEAWAATQSKTRWLGRVTRWEDKTHRAVYIRWDEEQRATCVRLEHLENDKYAALAERC